MTQSAQSDISAIGERLARVRETIVAAAQRAGRDPAAITLVGVSKTVERPAIDAAYWAGLRDFGENRVQAAKAKFGRDRPDGVTLHLIGSLQTNKVRDALALADLIHSVDRPSLVAALAKEAGRAERRVPILIEVNVAGEESKQGSAPVNVPALVNQILAQPALDLRGLMTMAPLVSNPEATRPVFRALRQLRDDLRHAYPQFALPDLSMGMTNDYPIAVEEGATIVRVGRAIFDDGSQV
jgi:PLP dependent protein